MTMLAMTTVSGQNFELGKVSVAELQEKAHPTDSSAAAAILFSKGRVWFDNSNTGGFVMATVVKAKIKIYKKEGYEWATKQVQYYTGHNSREKVDFTNVATYNLVDGKIEKTKIKSDGEFDEKINEYWAVKKITLPNVKEGSVIEFQYTIISPNITEMRDWTFQASIPVNFSEFKTDIPEYFIYNAAQRGYIFPKVTNAKESRTMTVTGRDESAVRGGVPQSSQLSFLENRTTYTATAMPALRNEAYVNNISNYTSGITHELALVKYPQEPQRSFATDWNAVVKKIYENDDFGGELNKTGYFEEDLKKLTSGLTDKTEITTAIFNYVKSAVLWNGKFGYNSNNGVRAAYKSKTGNVAEINLMLTAMLRAAGVTANPVLVSTRANGIVLFPNRTAFNYIIAAVETPAGPLLLDATEKYAAPDVLPVRDINWFGRLIRPDGSSTEIDLVPKTVSKKTTNIIMTPAPDGTITGKIRTQFTDQDAFAYRQNFADAKEDSYVEHFQNLHTNVDISEYKRENHTDISKPVVESFSFTDKGSVEIIGDRMYISPMLFFAENTNPFRTETREYPIDFSYPQQRKYAISIDVPAGYVVESLPAPVSLATEGNQTAFRYVIAATGNKIQVSVVSDINAAVISAEYYAALKDYFQQMVNKQSEKIILKKA